MPSSSPVLRLLAIGALTLPAAGLAASIPAGRSVLSAPCGPPISAAQSVARVSADIRAAQGKPTKEGLAYLAAASGKASPAAPLAAPVSDDGYSVGAAIVATDAKPVVTESVTETPAATAPAAAPPARSLSALRPLGATGAIGFNCGPGFTANLIWYCSPGSECTTTWHFFIHAAMNKYAGACPIVNRYSCQVYALAKPGSGDQVAFATAAQTRPGVPVVADKWCSY
jgi:hypothetical protein